MTSPLLLDRHGDVALLTLNRPEDANAIDIPTAKALHAHAKTLAREGWARAVVLTGKGRFFSGGGDVAAFAGFVETNDRAGFSAFLDELIGALHEGIEALLALDAPLIVGVNGVAAGAGMSLAIAGDLAYAAPSAKFVPAYPGIGFTADGGMSWFLPRIVGERKAAELMLTNATLDAESAQRLGIVTGILADADFNAALLARARTVAAGPRRALGDIRRLLRQSAGATLHDQLAAEKRSMTALAAGDDVQEGVAALRAKRKPAFKE